jgi:hypothetical protein
MRLPRVLAVTGVIALLISASPSALAAAGGTAASAGTWAGAAAPLPANADSTFARLTSVACPTVAKCIAVGSYFDPAGDQGLLLTKSGSKWTAAQAPLPAGAAADPDATLESIHCFSPSVCAAIGSYTDSSGNPQWMLLTTSGSSWTAAEAPVPPGAASDPLTALSAVSCASPTSCLAVGSYVDSANDIEGLLITGFGTQWAATQAPLPSNAATDPGTEPEAVTCTGSTRGCVAVGTYDTPGSPEVVEGLLLTGSGSSWTATEAPLPANASTTRPHAQLQAVRCQSSSSCTVAGSYMTPPSPRGTYGMLVTGSGTSWAAAQAPLPANARQTNPNVWLTADACGGITACTAAGEYDKTGGMSAAMLVTVSGSSLATLQAPLPRTAATKNPEPYLGAVACESAAACVATGSYQIRHDRGIRGLLVYGGGSSWTAIQAPVPGHAAGSSDVTAVSCAKNASNCVAVGYYLDNAGNDHGLLLTGRA